MLTVLITLMLKVNLVLAAPVWISEQLPALIQLYNKNAPDAEVVLFSVEKHNASRGKEIRAYYLNEKLNLDSAMPRLGLNKNRVISLEETGEKFILKRIKKNQASLEFADKSITIDKNQAFAEMTNSIKEQTGNEKLHHANIALAIVLLSEEYVEGEWGNFIIRKNTKRYVKHCQKLTKRKTVLKPEAIDEIKFRQKLLGEWKPISHDDQIALPILEEAMSCYQKLLTQNETLKKAQ